MPNIIAHSATEFKFGANEVQNNFLQPYVAMALNANQALSNSSDTLMLFNRTIYDEFNTYNSLNGRFTMPLAGLYCVSMFSQLDIGDGKIQLILKKNDSMVLNSFSQQSKVRQAAITGFVPLAANDHLKMFVSVGVVGTEARGDANVDRTGICIWRVGEKA